MTGKESFGYDPLAWLREEEPASADAAAAEPEPAVQPAEPPETDVPAEKAVADAGTEAPDVLELPDVLHVSEVGSLKGLLSLALESGGPITLDGGTVERADGASLQLLCAFARSAKERNTTVRWQAVSESLSQAAATLGVEQDLFG